MRKVNLNIGQVRDVCVNLLISARATRSIAATIVDDLIKNELEGYSSHGIMRVIEYFNAIKAGMIDPQSTPSKRALSNFVTVVNGQKAFGALVSSMIQIALSDHLKNQGFGFVSLTNNTSHIGRMSHIAMPIAEKGGLLLGFCNYSGSGQVVPPYGGSKGRLCTNPLVFAAPFSKHHPVVFDMTTTSVSEGKVRQAHLQRKKIPPGWLIDAEWKNVSNPGRLYENPPTAFLMPLGGKKFGYKGFGLAMMVEILAGVLTGTGYSRKHPDTFGNSAFFMVLSPEILGGTVLNFEERLEELILYVCQECPSAEGFGPIRVPGWHSQDAYLKNLSKKVVKIPSAIWNSIINLTEH